jgi:hypothetical protein
MKTLLSTFAVLFISIIVFSSCKKTSSPNPSNIVTATIGGTNYTFNLHVIEAIDTLGNLQVTQIAGSDADSDHIGIIFQSVGNPTATTYSESQKTAQLIIGISKDSVTYFSYYPNFSPVTNITSNPVTITIDSISSTSIQGTFQGEIYLTSDTTVPTKKAVTNGKFNLSL